jgi:DNA polymerase-3 subunit gamma/tau
MAKRKSSDGERGTAEGATETKPYVVLARKYRPETFEHLIGQKAMVQTLSNAFAADRIAQAYMLTGVRGVGKTTTARILARALNYEKEGVPPRPTIAMDGYGRHCAEIIQSRHPDVLEMDAASNTGVDNIREIIESARYKPLLARYKVFIIDEVHMLSKGAFNALLKTLEEPPEHVKFIFATTEIRKVPVTVLSRCQRFDLRRVDVPVLTTHFERIVRSEGANAEREALALIARAAEGSVRDGLSLLDQAIAMGSGKVGVGSVRAMLGLADRGRVFDLLELVLSGKAGPALADLGALHRDGAEPAQVLSDLAEAVHLATRIKVAGAEVAGDMLSAEERGRATALADKLSIPLLARAWQMLLKGIEEASRAPDPLAAAEMVLVRMAHTADLPAPDEVIRMLGGSGQAPQVRSSEPPRRQPSHAGASPSDVATAARPPRFDPETVATDLGPTSFLDVIALASQQRDAMLKVHLEEHVSLVRFEPGHIEINLLEGATPSLAGELSEKLTRWTGRRWIVAISRERGEPAVGAVRREREQVELEQLKAHPAVKAALDAFPDANVRAVRRIEPKQGSDRGGQ